MKNKKQSNAHSKRLSNTLTIAQIVFYVLSSVSLVIALISMIN